MNKLLPHQVEVAEHIATLYIDEQPKRRYTTCAEKREKQENLILSMNEIFLIAMRLTNNNRTFSQDLMQEVATRILKYDTAAPDFSHAYLERIVRNEIARIYKKEKMYIFCGLVSEFLETPLLCSPLDEVIEAEKRLEASGKARLIKKNLSPRQWNCLVLSSDGYSRLNISEILGISEVAVKKALLTGRKKAKNILENVASNIS